MAVVIALMVRDAVGWEMSWVAAMFSLGPVSPQGGQGGDYSLLDPDHGRKPGNGASFVDRLDQSVDLSSGQSCDTLQLRGSSSRGFGVETKFSRELGCCCVRRADSSEYQKSRIRLPMYQWRLSLTALTCREVCYGVEKESEIPPDLDRQIPSP